MAQQTRTQLETELQASAAIRELAEKKLLIASEALRDIRTNGLTDSSDRARAALKRMGNLRLHK